MKLIRYGQEKPGVVFNGQQYDTLAFGEDANEASVATDGPGSNISHQTVKAYDPN